MEPGGSGGPSSFDDFHDRLKGLYGTADNVVEEFYVPLLARSKSYDRVAGYFSSQGLALAARGLAAFINGGGSMRLIVGAQLSPEDVAALNDGAELAQLVEERLAENDLWTDADAVQTHRLSVLAWLAKEGRLEIKVGIPVVNGKMIAATETMAYFHDKFGVFTDHHGQQVTFIGSNNDSHHGWIGNSETFTAIGSWIEGWTWSGVLIVKHFEQFWNDDHSENWKVISLSQAVRDDLLRVESFSGPPPLIDPELPEAPEFPTDTPVMDPEVREDDAAALADLLSIPTRSPFTGVTSAGVEALPHQRAVIDRAVRTYPRGYLFGDEVGLGKTIEVGLTIRELTLSGSARRTLVLVPAAVLTQWQEELSEKVSLWVPRWAEGRWVWPDGSETEARAGDPWASDYPITLVSSHLARRGEQRPKVVSAAPWDVVVVDEAHHARRKGGKADATPNALLTLLQNLRDNDGWGALYLASATPMQMYPHEAWDLIELFGLPGWWAESADKFETYFRELGLDWDKRQWNFIAKMLSDHFSDPATEPNEHLDAQILAEVSGPDRVSVISGAGPRSRVAIAEKLCRPTGETVKANKQWCDPIGQKPQLASTVTAWMYTNNPMRDRVFRNTRDTLRAYRDAGAWPIEATIPDRVVNDFAVKMSDVEQELYCAVQDYIRTKYDQSNQFLTGQAKNAVGFILTVYRRRLTSSFYAIEQSLRRRIEALEKNLDYRMLLSADDSLFEEAAEAPAELADWALGDEVATLRVLTDRIAEIAAGDESKMIRLHQVIDEALSSGHQTVLVFTQFSDTMRYVRDRLDIIYKGNVIGYDANGGYRRNPQSGEWDFLTKRETKDLFLSGAVSVLVGTDTLSEGLNLQTCGRLVNYDLPWNFTRVEQRIGRVDRIGGHETVEVTNLLYDGTVETKVYKKLIDSFGGFNAVVGIAQPVLGQIEDVIKDGSMSDLCDDHENPTGTVGVATLFGDPNADGLLALDDAVAAVIAAANDTKARTLAQLDEHGSPIVGTVWEPEMGLVGLRDSLLDIPSVNERLVETSREGVFRLSLPSGSHEVTFDRAVLERYVPEVQLLTWGSPFLEELRSAIAAGTESPEDIP